MSQLPQFLRTLKTTVPQWVDRVSHPSGPGRFRFAIDAYEPMDLDSSCLTHTTVCTLGHRPGERERQGWVDYLLDMQRESDGLLIDEGLERHIISKGDRPSEMEVENVRRWTTRNGLMTVMQLGGKPRYRLAHKESFETPGEIVEYMENLHWDNPWGAGSWAGAVLLFQHFNRMCGDERAEANIQAGVDWLLAHQRPEDGAWTDGTPRAPHIWINGIFKVWMNLLEFTDFPIQYPERIVDLCIKGLTEDPALTGTPDSCSIFDVALVLDVALRRTDHRRDEVAELARSHLPTLEPMVREDGAFSYYPDKSLPNHGGLALAPVKEQSDAAGTAINVSAAALLANLGGLRDELGWTPLTEWRFGL